MKTLNERKYATTRKTSRDGTSLSSNPTPKRNAKSKKRKKAPQSKPRSSLKEKQGHPPIRTRKCAFNDGGIRRITDIRRMRVGDVR
jgi:hypothetical protein